MRPDGVGVDPVVELRERAVEVPREGEAAVFVLLEPLEFFDQVELELGAQPSPELKCDVRVRVCATAISTGSGLDANSTGGLDPLSRGQGKTVQPGLAFKGLEFDTFKPRVVDSLPNADVFQGVSVPHPIVDQRIVAELPCHVGQGNEVTTVFRENGDVCPLDGDGGFFGLAHGRERFGIFPLRAWRPLREVLGFTAMRIRGSRRISRRSVGGIGRTGRR